MGLGLGSDVRRRVPMVGFVGELHGDSAAAHSRGILRSLIVGLARWHTHGHIQVSIGAGGSSFMFLASHKRIRFLSNAAHVSFM